MLRPTSPFSYHYNPTAKSFFSIVALGFAVVVACGVVVVLLCSHAAVAVEPLHHLRLVTRLHFNKIMR
jgi:hypothetical protein